MKEQIWSGLCNIKYKSYLSGLLIERFQKKDRRINILIAVASSGSIAAWAFWQIVPIIWGGIIAASQVAFALKPYFPFSKYVKELNKKSIQIENLTIDYEKLWYKYQYEKIDEDTAVEEYFELKKRQTELLNFSDETILSVGDKTKKEANKRMKIYLKSNFGMTININQKQL